MHGTQLDVRAYQTAERLLRHHRKELVFGDRVTPRWLENGARFWYSVSTSKGKRFVLVDVKAGTRQEAFDHERLARALAEASGQSVDAAALPFPSIQPDAEAVEFDAFGKHWRCRLGDYTCERTEARTPGNPLEVVSPDGRYAVYRAGHDLRAAPWTAPATGR